MDIKWMGGVEVRFQFVYNLFWKKQAAFWEPGLQNIGAQSGGSIHTRASQYIAWAQVTPSTGRTPVPPNLPTPKGHVIQSKPYIWES